MSIYSEVFLTQIWAQFLGVYICLSLCVCVCVFLLSCYSRKGYQKGPVRTLAFLKNCDWINLFSLWAAISENYKPVKS